MSNTSSSPNISTVSVASPPFLALTTWIVTVVIGVISIFVNVLTITVIRKSKNLQGPCFKLIAAASFGSLLASVSYAVPNVARLGELAGHWSLSNRYRATCLLINVYVLSYVGYPFHTLTVTLVAVDRMFSVVLMPVKYRRLAKRAGVIGLSVCSAFAVLETVILTFSGDSFNKVIPTCSLLSTMGADSYAVFNQILVGLHAVCVFCYLAMFTSAYVQQRKMKARINDGSAEASELQQFFKQQALIMPAAKMLAVLYVITAVATRLVVNFVPVYGTWYYISFIINPCTTLVEFISLVTRCSHFREYIFRRNTGSGSTGNQGAGSNVPQPRSGW